MILEEAAFEIVSIDISDVDVGENIGARLQRDQADADSRIARATAEATRAEAIARKQQMIARVAECRALLVNAEAQVPAAMAVAFRAGNLHAKSVRPSQGIDRIEVSRVQGSPDRRNSPAIHGDEKSSQTNPNPRSRDERE